MAQHDMNVANQTFPDFRSDLNNALEALASSSLGDDEPTTTFAGMLWFDTTDDELKIRNADDNGWIVLSILASSAQTLVASAIQQPGSGAIEVQDEDGDEVLKLRPATTTEASDRTDNTVILTPENLPAYPTFSISDGDITTAKLANSAVTAAKIAANSVGLSKLAHAGSADYGKAIGYSSTGVPVAVDIETPGGTEIGAYIIGLDNTIRSTAKASGTTIANSLLQGISVGTWIIRGEYVRKQVAGVSSRFSYLLQRTS